MESSRLVISCILVALLFCNFAASDFEKDKEKCQNQVIGLATCLPYVGGEAKAPPPDCCTGFKQVLQNSRECICLLIKYRNDPNLGLKINATLALGLPARCKAPANQTITDCPAILHLPPNSPDAKVFDDFAKSANSSSSTKSAPPATSTGNSSPVSATADQKSDGGKKKGYWLGNERASVLMLLAVVALHILLMNL